MKPNPCKDCTERHHKCHSECEAYQQWKTANARPYKRDEAAEFLLANITKQKRKDRR